MMHQEIYQLMKYKRDELSARLTNIQQDFCAESPVDDVLFTVAHQTKIELHEVKKVIDEIEHGSFGYCQTCKLPIEAESLSKNPFETSCNKCKSAN
jgi:RNA polymerase-binding transcription factor DksA